MLQEFRELQYCLLLKALEKLSWRSGHLSLVVNENEILIIGLLEKGISKCLGGEIIMTESKLSVRMGGD